VPALTVLRDLVKPPDGTQNGWRDRGNTQSGKLRRGPRLRLQRRERLGVAYPRGAFPPSKSTAWTRIRRAGPTAASRFRALYSATIWVGSLVTLIVARQSEPILQAE
jgi:hypothetical protein